MRKILKKIGITLLSIYVVIEIIFTYTMNKNPNYEGFFYSYNASWYQTTLTYLIFFYDDNDGYVGG